MPVAAPGLRVSAHLYWAVVKVVEAVTLGLIEVPTRCFLQVPLSADVKEWSSERSSFLTS